MRHSSSPAFTFGLALAVMAAALAGCASGPSVEGSYSARVDKLAAECQARGGILIPTGQESSQPAADNACKITGSTSRLNR